MHRSKEKIHSEIELIIYQLKWYSPTSIISLALLVWRAKLVLLLTDILSELSLCFSFSFRFRFPVLILPQYWNSRGTSYYSTIVILKITSLCANKWLIYINIYEYYSVQLNSSWEQFLQDKKIIQKLNI